MNLVELKKAINSLSYSDKRELLEALERSAQSHSIHSEIEEQRFSKGIYCPHCGCVENVQKFGNLSLNSVIVVRIVEEPFLLPPNPSSLALTNPSPLGNTT